MKGLKEKRQRLTSKLLTRDSGELDEIDPKNSPDLMLLSI